MASSVKRSLGFSRREQYTNFAAWVVAVLGAVIGITLLVLSWTRSDRFEDARGAASDVTRPVAVAGTEPAVGRQAGVEVEAAPGAGHQAHRDHPRPSSRSAQSVPCRRVRV